MAFKIDETKIYSSDKLVKFDDGSFSYFDTYGERTNFNDAGQLRAWLFDNGDNSDELDAWIDAE